MSQPIDYSQLDKPVTFSDIDRHIKQGFRGSKLFLTNRTSLIIAIVSAVLAVAILLADAHDYIKIFVVIVLPIVSLSALSFLLSNKRLFGIEIKLVRFAEANGLIYNREERDTDRRTGLIFGRGSDKRYYNTITPPVEHGANYEFGQYRYTVSQGKSAVTHAWSYIAIELSRNLPHIVLDGKKNNQRQLVASTSNLPVSYDRSQILSLEGDFDKCFTLYAPKEYERDALYIFTPDLMALMIDEASPFDAEIIDNHLYFYTNDGPVYNKAVASREYIERVLRIISIIGEKTDRNTDYYMDERAVSRAANTVDQKGKRLKTKMKWTATLITVIYVTLLAVYLFITFVR